MKKTLTLFIVLGTVIPLTVIPSEDIYMTEDGSYRFKYTQQQMAERMAERAERLRKEYGIKGNKKIAKNTTRISSQLKLRALQQERGDEIIRRALIIHSESLKRNKTGVWNDVDIDRLINEIKQIHKEFEPFYSEELQKIKETQP